MICGGGIGKLWDVLFGDDEDVGGGLGRNVAEGETEIIFVDDVRGDFFAEDFAEEGGVSHRI